MSPADHFRACGSITLVLTIVPGKSNLVSVPATEELGDEAVRALFTTAEVEPQSGVYIFEVFGRGTTMTNAPSEEACAEAESLEVVVDREVGQRLFARVAATHESALPSDSSGGGMHGEGLHGST